MRTFQTHGFDVALHPMPGPIVTVRIVVNAGSFQETRPGTAHFLEHMFFKGTKKKSYVQINREIAAIGDHNAYTSNDKTVYFISTTRDNALKALDYLCEMMWDPALLPEEFEKERTVILEELRRANDDPGHSFFRGAEAVVYQPQLGHPILGEEADVRAMTLDDLQEFRTENYGPGNVLIALAGDVGHVTEENVACALDPYWDRHHICRAQPNIVPTLNMNLGSWTNPLVTRFEHTSEQAWVGLWMRGYDLGYSLASQFADDVACNLLGGGLHSILFNRLREELGLCYTTGMAQDNNWGNAATIAYCLLDPKNVDQAIVEMRKCLEQVAYEGFPDDLLEASVSNLLFDVAKGEQTPGGWAHRRVDRWFYYERAAPGVELSYDFLHNCVRSGPVKDMVQAYARSLIEGGLTMVIMNGDKTTTPTE